MTMTSEAATDLTVIDARPHLGEISRGWRLAAMAGRILLAILFLVAGVMKLAAVPFEVRSFAHFGYAPWFMYLIGVIELIGGLMLLIPRFTALGALAMMPILVGAALSHLLAGDPIVMILPSVVLLGLVGWLCIARQADLAWIEARLRMLVSAP